MWALNSNSSAQKPPVPVLVNSELLFCNHILLVLFDLKVQNGVMGVEVSGRFSSL